MIEIQPETKTAPLPVAENMPFFNRGGRIVVSVLGATTEVTEQEFNHFIEKFRHLQR